MTLKVLAFHAVSAALMSKASADTMTIRARLEVLDARLRNNGQLAHLKIEVEEPRVSLANAEVAALLPEAHVFRVAEGDDPLQKDAHTGRVWSERDRKILVQSRSDCTPDSQLMTIDCACKPPRNVSTTSASSSGISHPDIPLRLAASIAQDVRQDWALESLGNGYQHLQGTIRCLTFSIALRPCDLVAPSAWLGR